MIRSVCRCGLPHDGCPSCNKPPEDGGTEVNGASDPKRAGGGEHVCHECASMLRSQFIIKFKPYMRLLVTAMINLGGKIHAEG